jgi:hypothetical protein
VWWTITVLEFIDLALLTADVPLPLAAFGQP